MSSLTTRSDVSPHRHPHSVFLDPQNATAEYVVETSYTKRLRSSLKNRAKHDAAWRPASNLEKHAIPYGGIVKKTNTETTFPLNQQLPQDSKRAAQKIRSDAVKNFKVIYKGIVQLRHDLETCVADQLLKAIEVRKNSIAGAKLQQRSVLLVEGDGQSTTAMSDGTNGTKLTVEEEQVYESVASLCSTMELASSTAERIATNFLSQDEKRHLGGNTHKLQTEEQKKRTYQYYKPKPAPLGISTIDYVHLNSRPVSSTGNSPARPTHSNRPSQERGAASTKGQSKSSASDHLGKPPPSPPRSKVASHSPGSSHRLDKSPSPIKRDVSPIDSPPQTKKTPVVPPLQSMPQGSMGALSQNQRHGKEAERGHCSAQQQMKSNDESPAPPPPQSTTCKSISGMNIEKKEGEKPPALQAPTSPNAGSKRPVNPFLQVRSVVGLTVEDVVVTYALEQSKGNPEEAVTLILDGVEVPLQFRTYFETQMRLRMQAAQRQGVPNTAPAPPPPPSTMTTQKADSKNTTTIHQQQYEEEKTKARQQTIPKEQSTKPAQQQVANKVAAGSSTTPPSSSGQAKEESVKKRQEEKDSTATAAVKNQNNDLVIEKPTSPTKSPSGSAINRPAVAQPKYGTAANRTHSPGFQPQRMAPVSTSATAKTPTVVVLTSPNTTSGNISQKQESKPISTMPTAATNTQFHDDDDEPKKSPQHDATIKTSSGKTIPLKTIAIEDSSDSD